MRFDKFLGDNAPIGDVWVAGMSQVRPLLLFDLLLDVPGIARDQRVRGSMRGVEIVQEMLYGVAGGTGSVVLIFEIQFKY